MTFDFTPPDGRFDPELCIRVGQVFRWTASAGVIEGPDGENRYKLALPHPNPLPRRRAGTASWLIDTSADETEFRRLFSFNLNANELDARLIRADERIAPFLNPDSGLRMMQPADAVEVFYSFLCTANNHLKRIVPMVHKLAEYGCGGDIPVPGQALLDTLAPRSGMSPPPFPGSEVIASVPEQELRAKGFGYRAATITHAAQEVMRRGGDEWLFSLRAVSYEEAHNELLTIKGVGRKLADCICLFGLHHTEAVPIDTHMWQIGTRVFFPEWHATVLTERKYLQLGDFMRERFGKLAGWAHQQMYVHNLLKKA